MIRILIGALVCVLVTTPALARNITKEVRYFRNLDVVYSEKAHVCGLKDREPYPTRLLWGDTHLHINLSLDARAAGVILGAGDRWSLARECRFGNSPAANRRGSTRPADRALRNIRRVMS